MSPVMNPVMSHRVHTGQPDVVYAGDIIINEVRINPSGSDNEQEWFD